MPLPDRGRECIDCSTVTDGEILTQQGVCVGRTVAAAELSGTLTDAREAHETVRQSREDQTSYPPHVRFAIFSPNYVIEISCQGNRRYGM